MKQNRLGPKLRFKGFNGDWVLKKLEDVTDKIQDGTHFSPKQKEYGTYKYITSKNIRNGFMDLKDVLYLDDNSHREIYKRCDVKFNDILLTKDGASTGTACLNELHEEFSLLSSVAFIRANKSLATNFFIYQYLAGPKGQYEIKASIAGQAITRITLSKIRDYKFSYPSLPEQQKIASFLSAVDEKIQQLTRKKELLEQYKKGVMQQLFSGKLRFKDENGKDYPEWEEKLLGDICEVKGGKRIPLGYSLIEENNGHPYITVSDIENDSVSLDKIKYVPLDAIDAIKNYKITTDDIFISVAGTLGLVGIIPQSLNNANLTENCNKLTNLKCDQKYLLQFLKTDKLSKLIKSVGTMGAQPKLAIYAIKALELSLPTIQEQQKIARYLSAIDNKIETVNTLMLQSQTFKKGLLQQMFV